MRIDDKTFKAMPANLRALFVAEPNPERDEVLAAFPQAPGQQGDVSTTAPSPRTSNVYGAMARVGEASQDSDNGGVVGFKMKPGARRLDSGSAARFFYCAKASKKDRDEGCEGLPQRVIGTWGGDDDDLSPGKKSTVPRGNTHPTVKPTDLMRYLCSLVTPAGGLVLDPFAGSGSTGKGAALAGLHFVGVERELAYVDIAERRIATAYFGRLAFGEAARDRTARRADAALRAECGEWVASA